MNDYENKNSNPANQALKLWKSGRRLEALGLFDLAIKCQPESSILLLNRAQLHVELGNLTEALRDFEEARKGEPKLPEDVFVMQEGLQAMSPAALKLFIQERKNATKS